ncbi:MAG: hypothetical protein U0894_02090 [Pirellulales bacterium]
MAACLLGTLHKENPTGLGRIVRGEGGEFVGIVEEKDATPGQRQITEVNMSTYVFSGPDLMAALDLLGNDNRQRVLPDRLSWNLAETGEIGGSFERFIA